MAQPEWTPTTFRRDSFEQEPVVKQPAPSIDAFAGIEQIFGFIDRFLPRMAQFADQIQRLRAMESGPDSKGAASEFLEDDATPRELNPPPVDKSSHTINPNTVYSRILGVVNSQAHDSVALDVINGELSRVLQLVGLDQRATIGDVLEKLREHKPVVIMLLTQLLPHIEGEP